MSSSGQKRYDEFIKILKEANHSLTKENQARELWNKVKLHNESLSKTSSKTEKYFKKFLDESNDIFTVNQKPRKESDTTPFPL